MFEVKRDDDDAFGFNRIPKTRGNAKGKKHTGKKKEKESKLIHGNVSIGSHQMQHLFRISYFVSDAASANK